MNTFKYVCVLTVMVALQAQGSFGSVEILIEGCVIPCSHGGYFRHPSDCSKFVQCALEGPVEMECPLGTIWDQSLRTCNFVSAVACETGQYSTPDGAPCNQNDDRSQNDGNGEITDDGSENYRNGERTDDESQNERNEEVTDDGSQKDETEVNSIPVDVNESEEVMGAPEQSEEGSSENGPKSSEDNENNSSSSKESSSSTDQSENDSTEVNESKDSNEDKYEDDSTNLKESTLCNEEDKSENDSTNVEELPSQTISAYKSTTPAECNFQCPSKVGVFSHPRDCSKYFICMHWFPIELQCPPGLHFRGAYFFCDNPELAMCRVSSVANC